MKLEEEDGGEAVPYNIDLNVTTELNSKKFGDSDQLTIDPSFEQVIEGAALTELNLCAIYSQLGQ